MQSDFWNKKVDLNKLKGYVYGLVDPAGKRIFYIGRGGGMNAQGNTRPNSHLIEAMNYRKSTPTHKNLKLETINQIWDANKLVELAILRRGMDLETAIHVEAALIESFNYSSETSLTNKIDGVGNDEFGLIDSNNAVNLYASPLTKYDSHFENGINLWIFPIKNNLKKGLDPYKSTISAWKVNNKNNNLLNNFENYAIGVDGNQISRSVIKIENWVNDTINGDSKKSMIIGTDISQNSGEHFFEKSFEKIINKDYSQVSLKEKTKNHCLGYWLNGNYLIVNINKDVVTYIRGNKSYKSIYI